MTGNVENVDPTITHIEPTVINVVQRNTIITIGKVRTRNRTFYEKVTLY
jgi:hypothetical protein